MRLQCPEEDQDSSSSSAPNLAPLLAVLMQSLNVPCPPRRLQHAGEEGSHAEESEQKSGSSKYGKLFAKMWGGSTKSTTTAADIEPFKVESSKGSLSSGVAGSGPSLTRAATVGEEQSRKQCGHHSMLCSFNLAFKRE
jgi:hypothetical protein